MTTHIPDVRAYLARQRCRMMVHTLANCIRSAEWQKGHEPVRETERMLADFRAWRAEHSRLVRTGRAFEDSFR